MTYCTALKFGATEFFNPTNHSRPAQQVLSEMTDGGLDYTFECIGNVTTMVSWDTVIVLWLSGENCMFASVLLWRRVIKVGVCPLSSELLLLGRRYPHVHFSWLLDVCGREQHLEVCNLLLALTFELP